MHQHVVLNGARPCNIKLNPEFDWRTDEANKAIGYLATWAINGDSNRYAGSVTVWGDKEGNLHARYTDTDGKITFVLFGMNDAGLYSFHS